MNAKKKNLLHSMAYFIHTTFEQVYNYEEFFSYNPIIKQT